MSQSTPTTENRNVPGQTVAVPKPDNGADVAVASSPSGTLQLDFDPSTATTSREGNSLVFEVDGGGKVTVTDFFVVGDQSLPSLRLPDGTEVASADFFQGSDLDMTTAAGPAAAAPPGGGTNYADDPGNLMGGLDKFGMLGTDYWGRSTEPTPEMEGVREVPGGIFNFDVSTLFEGVFYGGLFEDGMRNKNVGDTTQVFGQLNFNPVLSGSTVIDAIRLSGFEPGTRIYFGEPSDYENGGNYIEITSLSQVVNFTHANFINGVYLVAPPYSDVDMTITVSMDIRAASSGMTATVGGSFVIIVDAVADLPEYVGSDARYDGFTGVGEIKKATDDDFDKNTGVESKDSTGSADMTKVMFDVSATFRDLDGSETHFVLVERPADINGNAWSCDNPGSFEVQIWVDSNGKPVLDQANPPADAVQKPFFAIPVSLDQIGPDGSVTISVVMTPPDGFTVSAFEEEDRSLWTGAWASENPEDGEITFNNNDAHDFTQVEVTYEVPTLTVTMGWAYEGGQGNKHLADKGAYDGTPGTLEGEGSDAAITFTVDSGFITEVKIDVSGWLYGDGSAAARGVLTFADGTPVPAPDANGIITITLNPNSDSLELKFVPNPACTSDADVPIGYDVTVTTPNGTTLVYKDGGGTVAIDAVADAPENVGLNVTNDADYFYVVDAADGWDKSSVWHNPGTTANVGDLKGYETSTYTPTYEPKTYDVSITASAHFPDTDGSETHYIMVQNIGGDLALSSAAQAAGFEIIGKESYGGTEYFVVKVPEGFDYSATAPNVSVDLVYSITTDTSISKDINVYGKAVEGGGDDPNAWAGDREVDFNNNIAYSPGDKTNVTIDYVESTLTVKAGWAAEDHWYNQNRVDSNTPGAANPTNPTNLPGLSDQGADFIMSLNDVKDSFQSITLTYDSSLGTFIVPDAPGVYTWAASPPDSNGMVTVTVTYTQDSISQDTLSEFRGYFEPGHNNNKGEVPIDYKVEVVRGDSSQTYDGHSNVTIDAAADLPNLESKGELFYAGDNLVPGDPAQGDTAAKPGEGVTLKDLSVTFYDYGPDSQELHYFMVQKNASVRYTDPVGTLNTTVSLAAQDIVITGSGPSGDYKQTIHLEGTTGKSYITLEFPDGTIVTINSAGVSDNPALVANLAPNWVAQAINGVSTTTPNAGGSSTYCKLPVLNELLQGTDGKATVQEVVINAPTNLGRDGTVTINVGGYAEESEGRTLTDGGNATGDTPSREVYLDNNYADNLGSIKFDVGVVTSSPSFSATVVYENGTPDADKGDYTVHLGYISLAGLHKGETAQVEFIFKAGNPPVNLMLAEDRYTYDPATGEWVVAQEGAPLQVGYEYDAATGEWVLGGGGNWTVQSIVDNGDGTYSIKMEITGNDGGEVKLPFFPGNNGNGEDITVDYIVTITDDRSGESTSWKSPGVSDDLLDSDTTYKNLTGGGDYIIVDAVAQQPEFGHYTTVGKEIPGDEDGARYEYLTPRTPVEVEASIMFQDFTDDSQQHYLFLEWNPDVAALDYQNPNCLTYTYVENGVTKVGTITIPQPPVFQLDGGKIYIKVPVANEHLQKCENGILDLTVKYNGTSNNGSVTIRADAHDLEEAIGRPGGTEQGIRNDNNLSQNQIEVEFKYAAAGSVSIKSSNHLYEGDQPGANVGSDARAWGAQLMFGFSSSISTVKDADGNWVLSNTPGSGVRDTLDSLSITLPKGADGSDRGTLYLIESGKYPTSDAEWQALEAAFKDAGPDGYVPGLGWVFGGGALSDAQILALLNGGKMQFIPETDFNTLSGTDDLDLSISYNYTVTNHDSGHAPNNHGKMDMIVDAVAQLPEFVVAVDDNGSYAYTVKIGKLDYPDKDGSEDQFVLVKYVPGAEVSILGDDGKPVYFTEIFYAKGADGVVHQYIKIPASHFLDDNGVLKPGMELTINLGNTYLKNGASIEVSAVAIEKVGEGDAGELTYHNNTAVKEGVVITVPGQGHDHHGSYPHIVFTHAYENGTENAHIGQDHGTAGNVNLGDGIIRACEDTPVRNNDLIVLTFNPKEGTIVIDGQPLVIETGPAGWPNGVSIALDGSGNYVVTITHHSNSSQGVNLNADTVYFRPGDFSAGNNGDIVSGNYDPKAHYNYSDADVSISWQIQRPSGNPQTINSGTEDMVVDAVAQPGALDSVGNYDEAIGYGPGANDTVTIKVPFLFPDSDGSEDHYLLVEKQPGIYVVGANPADLIQVGDTTYYKLPIDYSKATFNSATGKWEMDVSIRVDNSMAHNTNESKRTGTEDGKTPEDGGVKDGSDIYKLKTGTMAVETGYRDDPNNQEVTADNNVAVNQDGWLEFKISTCDVKVTIGAIRGAYENGDVTGLPDGTLPYGFMPVTITHDENDVIESFTLRYNAGSGELKYGNGDPIVTDPAKGISVNGPDANGVVTITFTDPINQGTLGLINQGFQYHSTSHDSTDVGVNWSITAYDPLSGERGDASAKSTIVVDAVAQAPTLGDDVGVTYGEEGWTAAKSGEKAHVNIQLTFEDDGTHGEVHYAVFQRGNEWSCDGAYVNGDWVAAKDIILIYGKDGTAYFAVEIPAGVANADVTFVVTMPSKNADWEHSVKVGGISVEAFVRPDGDKELTLSNNWAETIEEYTFNVGVATSTSVSVALYDGDGNPYNAANPIYENDGSGGSVFINLVPNGANEAITKVMITDPGTKGSIWYDFGDGNGPTEISASGGWVTITDPNFDTSKLEFRPSPYWSGNYNPSVKVDVIDTASGDVKIGTGSTPAESITGSANIVVEGVATPPEDPGFDGQFSAADAGIYNMVLKATFPDHDGSEQHFFLFTLPVGLFLDSGAVYTTVTLGDGNVYGLPAGDYYRMDVASNVETPEITLAIRADSSWDGTDRAIDFHAVAQENGGTEVLSGTAGIDPAHGDFAYRVEYVDGTADFSHVTGDYLHVYGGAGDDVIYGGQGGNEIHGGGGDDIIYAGHGDDILFGGTGSDIFAWEADRLGGSDTIMDFDFNYQWNSETGKLDAIVGMDNDKIQLNFQDLLGDDSGSLTALLDGLHDLGGNKFGTDSGFTVSFLDTNRLEIMFTGHESGVTQDIIVNSGNAFLGDISNVSLTEAQAILQQILINNS
ncbi:MAG: hypothetical protein FWG04_00625 [Desulfovibrionaceae bacterium]|nr:hypothetical protein [Desulfovibrionaceae bacterium]